MKRSGILTLFLCLLIFNASEGRDQNYNFNTDFLQHEAPRNPTTPKRDYEAQQWPILGPSTSKSPGTAGITNVARVPSVSKVTPVPGNPISPKRDYVAPDFPPLKSPASTNSATSGNPSVPPKTSAAGGNPASPKRDYIAPNFPPLKTPASTNSATSGNPSVPPKTSAAGGNPASPKRDYVNTNFPALGPPASTNTNQPNNKVKDLVNFYDNKAKEHNGPNKMPSYSSIVQSSTGQRQQPNKDNLSGGAGTTLFNQPATQAPQGSHTNQNKPQHGFSAVVANSNQPVIPSNNRNTPIPTGNNKNTPNYVPNTPSTKPTSHVLPSSIAQNKQNKNSQSTNDNGPNDDELQALSEELLRKDSNNAAKYVTINYQDKTTSQSTVDKALQPLMTIADDTWNIPTIKNFVPLLDNYERDTLINEYVTPQERNEENAFMDVIMTTSVIRHLMTFFKEKGLVTPDPKQQRDFLKQLWFGLYSRGKGKISSSGFEHIFVSELKNGEVSGLHNWIYFAREEAASRANYLGYLKYVELNDKGAVLKLHFNQLGVDKPVDSMFIGTSPELEIALYTLCFVTRADRDCNLKLAGNSVNIITHTFRYRSKNLIGSAYPQI